MTLEPDSSPCLSHVYCCYVCKYLQAHFIITHDGTGGLLNASVSFLLGEVGEGNLVQEYIVEFIEVICDLISSCICVESFSVCSSI